MTQLLEINPENPQERKIQQAVDVLRSGGLIIYPTDTVYGIGCDLFNAKALEKVMRVKAQRAPENGQQRPGKMNLSFICYDLSEISQYARHIDNDIFKLMKKSLPGPYTFILESSAKVPKLLNVKKKQVGVRVPDHAIPRQIVKLMGNPLVTASIRDEDEVIEYSTDPSLIRERFEGLVDLVIDGGSGGNVASTVIDCTGFEPTVVREGAGSLEVL